MKTQCHANWHCRRLAVRHGISAMKILVTGATSGLGRNASEYLLGRGFEVVACGRNPQAGEQLVKMGAEDLL